MRKVVSKSEVAHMWANQTQQSARNSGNNFYFEGNTIYSYGEHFPIAIHHEGVVLFTLDSYSNTTAKHIHEVRAAISHKSEILCLHPDRAAAGNHESNINYWIELILDNGDKLARARKPMKYLSAIDNIKKQMQEYLDFFNISLSESQLIKISFSSKEEFVEASKKAAAEEMAERERRLNLGSKVNDRKIKAWKKRINDYDFSKSLTNEERISLSYFQRDYQNVETYLRVVEDTVETSKGMKIPVDVAKRYFEWYTRVAANGGCTSCNFKMLGYDVTEVTSERLIVGCHNIPYSEIKYIAEKLNW